jgi:chemotaxis protein MotA
VRTLNHSFRLSRGPTPFIAVVFAILLVLIPIFLGARGYLILISLVGLVIVVGGVIAVAFMSFAANEVRSALGAIIRMSKQTPKKADDLTQDVASIVKWSSQIRNNGMRQFEAAIGAASIDDPVIKYGLNMVLGEYRPDEIRSMINTAADASYEREIRPAEILEAMTSHAPAFGMVGTLIGMVAMLSDLSANMSAIGPSLGVAFLSTLYGVLSARMVYMPAATRLRLEVERQRSRHLFLAEGMAMLAGKKSPTYIQDWLNGFLRPEVQDYFGSNSKSAASAARLRVVGA